jgi:S1-C subfamily serine protease
MKLIRPILIGLFLAAAFFIYTSRREGTTNPTEWITRPAKVDITEAAGPVELDSEEQNNVALYTRVLPSVVNITTRSVSFDFFYGPVPQGGAGSGFIIDKEGHVLTNAHVIQGAQQIYVTLANQKQYKAEVVGSDRSHDLAVIQIKAPDLKPSVLGTSEGLKVGQKVYAIGNPFGLAGTMTRGIISSIRAVSEPGQGGASFDEAIQTDAAINPGNSGGPLLNSRGEVIGINTMILSNVGQSAGIGFAIPINTAKAVLNDLVTLGRVRRPQLGVRTLPIGPELAAQLDLGEDYGLLVLEAVPGSAAERAGIRGGRERAYLGNVPITVGGDLIVAIDGKPIEDQTSMSRAMNRHRAGDTVTVTVYRGKRKLDLKVTLDEVRSTEGRRAT